ncbi:protein of unknown function [Streptantibioticus cattleyicolor NRRL 8057 = DSM 46488]|nr:protein of unknown function [Streptantibioticus cattleyicolor NRRL 8057 = DSM 46488]
MPCVPPEPVCFTRAFFTGTPEDLISWPQAVAALERTPHPMSERDLRRKFRASGGRTYRLPGVRGELVSRSAIYEWHRDYWNGWLRIKPRTVHCCSDAANSA